VVIVYLHDRARIVEEQSPAGVTVAAYTYGNYIDEVLTMDRAGQTYYYHQNGLWSATALGDSAAHVMERYAYDAYGHPTISEGAGIPVPLNAWDTAHSAIGSPLLFTGRQVDEEAGLYYYRARYYDSGKGRFLQRDPLGYVDGVNLYAYVTGRPTSSTDPLGFNGSSNNEKVKQLLEVIEKAKDRYDKVQNIKEKLEIAANVIKSYQGDQEAIDKLEATALDKAIEKASELLSDVGGAGASGAAAYLQAAVFDIQTALKILAAGQEIVGKKAACLDCRTSSALGVPSDALTTGDQCKIWDSGREEYKYMGAWYWLWNSETTITWKVFCKQCCDRLYALVLTLPSGAYEYVPCQ